MRRNRKPFISEPVNKELKSADREIIEVCNSLMRESGVKESQISRLSSDFIYPMFTHELVDKSGL